MDTGVKCVNYRAHTLPCLYKHICRGLNISEKWEKHEEKYSFLVSSLLYTVVNVVVSSPRWVFHLAYAAAATTLMMLHQQYTRCCYCCCCCCCCCCLQLFLYCFWQPYKLFLALWACNQYLASPVGLEPRILGLEKASKCHKPEVSRSYS